MGKAIGLSGSICISDVPKELFVTGKNGKKYLNLTFFVSTDADQYGNHGGITLPQSEEERKAKAKKTFIGNVKGFWSVETDFVFEKKADVKQVEVVVEADDDDGLPF